MVAIYITSNSIFCSRKKKQTKNITSNTCITTIERVIKLTSGTSGSWCQFFGSVLFTRVLTRLFLSPDDDITCIPCTSGQFLGVVNHLAGWIVHKVGAGRQGDRKPTDSVCLRVRKSLFVLFSSVLYNVSAHFSYWGKISDSKVDTLYHMLV